jgi:hypothetical protein
MFQGPNSAFHDFVITCRGCRESIIARIRTMPDGWIIETCPFCLETRRYLRAEIFRGRISYRYAQLKVQRGLEVGGYTDRPDWPKVGPSLLISTCLILAIRTAKWAASNDEETEQSRTRSRDRLFDCSCQFRIVRVSRQIRGDFPSDEGSLVSGER